MAVGAKYEVESVRVPNLKIVSSNVIPQTSPEQIFGDFPLAKDGLQKSSQFANVVGLPPELTRRTLQARRKVGKVSEADSHKRGRAVEVYVRDIIATQTELVESVELHEKPDEKGSDVRIRLRKGLSVRELLGEIKSSSGEIRSAKKKLRNQYLIAEEGPDGQLTGPWVGKMNHAQWEALDLEEREKIISQLLTDIGTVLVNGGEKDNREKTPTEILEDSIYPQLQRKLSAATPEGSKKIGIFPQTDQLRIWEWIHTGEFTHFVRLDSSDNPEKAKIQPNYKGYQKRLWSDIPSATITDLFKQEGKPKPSRLQQLATVARTRLSSITKILG